MFLVQNGYNIFAMTVTIPKTITNGKDLVVISKEEYDALTLLKNVYEFQPTSYQKRVLADARKRRKKGEVLRLDEFRRNLGLTD